MATGEYGSNIDSLQWVGGNIYFPFLSYLKDNLYIMTLGSSFVMRTVEIDEDGLIGAAVLDTWNIEAGVTSGSTAVIHVADDVFAVAYRGVSKVVIKTFEVDDDGNFGTSIIDTINLANVPSNSSYRPFLIRRGTSNVFICAYTDNNDDGWVATVTINDDGSIDEPVLDSHEFHPGAGHYPWIVNVSGDTFAMIMSDTTSNRGEINTFTVDASGTITAVDAQLFESETNGMNGGEIIHVSGDIFLAVYSGPGSDGWAKTFDIDASGNIDPGGAVDTWEFETNYAGWPHIVDIGSNDAGDGEVFCVGYDQNSTAQSITFEVSNAGAITKSAIDSLTLVAADWTGSVTIFNVFGENFAFCYEELTGSNSGQLKTYSIGRASTNAVTVLVNSIDVTDYILAMHIEHGEDGELAEATTGICQLTCDNRNGDFSPENTGGAFYPDLVIGAVVEVYETFEFRRYDLFKGRIDSIDPLAEPTSPYAYLVVLDGMDDMKGTTISTPLRTNTDAGELFDDILDALGVAAGDRDLDAGSDVLQLGWFHKQDGLVSGRVLERVENGRFFVSPTGVRTFHNRHHRITGAGLVSQFDVAEKSVQLDYEYNKRLVKNVINLRGRRYFSGGGATLFSGYDLATLDSDLIWSAHTGDAGAPYVPQQTSLTLWADMNSPLAAYDTLVSDTHWNANTEPDKSGVDVTSNISLVQTQYGQSIKLVFTNNGSVGAYLVEPDTPPSGAPSDRTVLVYGTLYGEEVMAITEEDTTSQDNYGYRSLDIDLPFKSNPNDVISYAQYLKRKYKDAIPRAASVKLAHRTNWPDTTIKTQCLTREIGDRITVASSRLGFDRDFYINKVVHDYAFNEGGFIAETTWLVERAAGTVEEVFWILGEAGFSELGETTVLGF